MSARPLLSTAILLTCGVSLPGQTPAVHSPTGSDDRPKVVIIQYESGRVLVAREINGELLVVEPHERGAALLGAYLDDRGQNPVAPPAQPQARSDLEDVPMFFSPYWYGDRSLVNIEPPNDASPVGRAIERNKQNAAELRQQVYARRAEQGTRGTTNSSGQAYPSTAADAERDDRLARVQQQVNAAGSGGAAGWTPDTFYGLGEGLEYYRQEELAARKELALLSYDALLEEGLAFFSQRRYGQAARSFIGATQKDHGDAGSRLHAAQCLMATGLYRQALAHVQRAVELAPQLLYRPMNHRTNYAFPSDFDQHLAVLRQHVAQNPGDDAACLLLAYEQFFSDDPMTAAESMRRVAALSHTSTFARKLWRAAQPVFGDVPTAAPPGS